MAGLWSTGAGKIVFHMENEATSGNKRADGIFFLPQRPYMERFVNNCYILRGAKKVHLSCHQKNPNPTIVPCLSCRKNLALKNAALKLKKPSDDDMIQVLNDVRLGYILSRVNGLDSINEWSSVLSLGEQQRLAFARLLLSKPKLVLLDESTSSALDEDNEAHLYKQIRGAGITFVSVGHRRTLVEFHKKVLNITSMDDERPNWVLKDISLPDSTPQSATSL
ncbi:hypothetical protein ACHQM5_018323 [Ranunculus cassubicifolius]